MTHPPTKRSRPEGGNRAATCDTIDTDESTTTVDDTEVGALVRCIVERADARGLNPADAGGVWVSACPTHHGDGGAFEFDADDHGVWITGCRRGCLPQDIADTLGVDFGNPRVHAYAPERQRAKAIEHKEKADAELRRRIASGEPGRLGDTVGDIRRNLTRLLEKNGHRLHRTDRYVCPHCGDKKHGGLKVDAKDDKVLIHCHNKCGGEGAILAGLGLTWADLTTDRRPPLPDLSFAPCAPATLADVHETFTRWLGADYDLAALDAVLAAAAVEQLSGDPVWMLVVSGSGAAKTETVAALRSAGAIVTSTITSEGALLSGTGRKDRAKDATGGLLYKIGPRGLLVIKDVTSILSMNRDARAAVLAALREVYDGYWERNLGSDGGQTLTWQGRLVLIGAVTTAWDKAHTVISAMGDRFVLVRLDSTTGRTASGRQAIANTGREEAMRAELAAIVAGLMSTVDRNAVLDVTEDEAGQLLDLADVVTLARTAVDHDYRGDVIDAHAPEMPTRFAKQLTQVVRGALALGITRADAMRIAARCAADSVPPLRLAVLLDVADNPGSSVNEVRKRLDKPRATVDRTLQAVHVLGLAAVRETGTDKPGYVDGYWLADEVEADTLRLLGRTRNVGTHTRSPSTPQYPCNDISGTHAEERDAA